MQYVLLALIIIALLYAAYLFIIKFFYVIIPICVCIAMAIISKKIYNKVADFLDEHSRYPKINKSIKQYSLHNNDFELICSYKKKINITRIKV